MKIHTHLRPNVILLCCFCILPGIDLSAWGQKGHDIVCAIAERHLSSRAGRKVNDILEGKSMVYWANWMDNASHTPQYRYTSSWHYRNVDAGESYESAPLNPDGDVVTAVKAQVEALKNGSLNRDESALSLKMLVHLVGDLHCPMHLAHLSDRGGNRWQVRFCGRGTNLHSVWDSSVVESAHKWSYGEWAEQLDRAGRRECAEAVRGTVDDWAKETLGISSSIYESTPIGSELSYDYVVQWAPVVELQLYRAGLRLAFLLNDIF